MADKIIVVGGGLAGTFLTWELLDRGYEVIMFDVAKETSASRVAAGLYNVLTGMRATKSWMAETLMESLFTFFEKPGREKLKGVLHPISVYRALKTPFEYNEWCARSASPGYENLVRIIDEPILPGKIEPHEGGVEGIGTGWVDIVSFLDLSKERFNESGRYRCIDSLFNYSGLDATNNEYKHSTEIINYEYITFCEGIQATKNPFWFANPIIPLKGQVLQIKELDLDLNKILLNKVFLLPLREGTYMLGSTYERTYRDEHPDEAGRNELSEKLNEMLIEPQYSIYAHKAGIRPTTHDRRPALGRHPEFGNMYFLNGLGSKGLMIAPYFSAMLTDLLEGRLVHLPKVVDMSRLKPAPQKKT